MKCEVSLVDRIQEAEKQVRVGETYVHYRSKDKKYKVIAVGLLEANEEPCVVYQALYGDHLVWIRAVKVFVEYVDFEGKQVLRFQKI